MADASSAIEALRAENERLREALGECEELLTLVEQPAFVDPVHGAEVEALGRRIGFGALMSSASASWRTMPGVPAGSEYVAGPCHVSIVRALKITRAALERKPE